jgi:hypothetical protein
MGVGAEMNEKTNYLEEMRAELSQALGEAIWAFSMVERITYRYLKFLSSEPLDELMADQSFGARIKLIKHLVTRLKGQDEEKAATIGRLEQAMNLARTRNMLAHNPWQIWIDFDESTFKSEIRKATDETKAIDLTNVREFRDAARELASAFDYYLGQLRYPGP